MRLDWGDVPSGIGAVLTGISLLIAALTYSRSVKNAEMAQAELISGWIENDSDNHAIIAIRNASNLPIYMVEVHLDADEDEFRRFYIGTIFPGDTTKVVTDVWLQSAVPPDRISFIDAAGRRWKRGDNGELSRLKYKRFRAVLEFIWGRMRHPIAYIKWIVPSRYPMPLAIDEQLQARAIAEAVRVGYRKKTAKSAVEKYAKGAMLRRGEKMALGSAMQRSVDLREKVPDGENIPGWEY